MIGTSVTPELSTIQDDLGKSAPPQSGIVPQPRPNHPQDVPINQTTQDNVAMSKDDIKESEVRKTDLLVIPSLIIVLAPEGRQGYRNFQNFRATSHQ